MKRILIVTILLFVADLSFSQQRKIVGRVIATDTQKPLNEVSISSVSGQSAATNVVGFFEMNTGVNDTIVISKTGYITKKISVPATEKFQLALDLAPPVEFYKYISKNLMIPRAAKQQGIDGRFFVKFDANADGQISNVTVPKSLGDVYDKEATNVIAATPPDVVKSLVATTGATSFLATIQFRLGANGRRAEGATFFDGLYQLSEFMVDDVRR